MSERVWFVNVVDDGRDWPTLGTLTQRQKDAAVEVIEAKLADLADFLEGHIICAIRSGDDAFAYRGAVRAHRLAMVSMALQPEETRK